MLECQQMIELSWKFVWVHISPEERDYCDVKYDVRFHNIAEKFIQMILEGQQMIRLH